MNLATYTTRRPIATSMLFIALALVGVVSLVRLPVDFLPDISFPRLIVYTTLPSTAPVEIEERITTPIEQAVSTVAGVRREHSVSRDGLSLVTLEFVWGTKMDFAMLAVREKLDQLRPQLPQQADRPVVLREDPGEQPIMILAVTSAKALSGSVESTDSEISEDTQLLRLRELSTQIFKRRLEQIDGVALATVTGGFSREIHLDVDMQRLAAYNLSLAEVENALQSASDNRPGGTIRRGQFRYALRTLGEFEKVEDIAAVHIPLKGGGSVAVHDIALVREGHRERTGMTRYNGHETVGILLTKEAGANTVTVSGRVHQVLDEVRQQYPEVQIAVIDDEARFIREAIFQVEQELISGGILAFLVLLLFLGELRSPLIIAIAMPISVIVTFALFYFSGMTLNLISLGGLALGIGLLMDNSIVVLENIFRWRETGVERLHAAVEGTREMAMPITASTFTNIAVFLPLAYAYGVAGQLFRDQSFAVSYSLLVSLLVAVTLLPMLAARKNQRRTEDAPANASSPSNSLEIRLQRLGSTILSFPKNLLRYWVGLLAALYNKTFLKASLLVNRLFQQFTVHYERLLARALEAPQRVLFGTILAFLSTAVLSLFVGRELLPRVDQRQFMVGLALPIGSTLEATAAISAEVERMLLAEPAIEKVFTQVGRGEQLLGEVGMQDIEKARILVQLGGDAASTEKVMATIRGKLPAQGVTLRRPQTQFSRMLGLQEADIAVHICGTDFTTALRLLDTLQVRCKGVAGLVDVRRTYEAGAQEIHLTIDREAAARHGVLPATLAGYVETTMRGAVPTTFKDFDQKLGIVLRAQEKDRHTLAQLLDTPIPTTNGNKVPLRVLVTASNGSGPAAIYHDNQARTVTLLGNISGRDFGAVTADLQRLVEKIPAPPGFEIRIAGQREEMRLSFRSLIMAIALAVLLIYMILAAEFESLKYPFIIMLSAPLSLIGVVIGLLMTGQTFNLMSLIGVMVLVGIVDNDAIVKIDAILAEKKAGRPLREAIVIAGQKRLRPIVMNTVTAVFGLLPMLLLPGEGAELYRPLAATVIFGLIVATALTLIVVPVVVLVMEKSERRKGGVGERGMDGLSFNEGKVQVD